MPYSVNFMVMSLVHDKLLCSHNGSFWSPVPEYSFCSELSPKVFPLSLLLSLVYFDLLPIVFVNIKHLITS